MTRLLNLSVAGVGSVVLAWLFSTATAIAPHQALSGAGDPLAIAAAVTSQARVGGPPFYALQYRGEVDRGLLVDVSGSANPARLTGMGLRGGGSAVRSLTRRGDPYLRFGPRVCPAASSCTWAVATPVHDVGPGRGGNAPFAFGAMVRLTEPGHGSAMTVMQRGSGGGSDQGGGAGGGPRWALEVDDGQVSCRWSDGVREVLLPDDLGRSFRLAVGRWYGLRCMRAAGGRFNLTVTDPMTAWPLARYTVRNPAIGAISASGPTTIGGSARRGADQFRGDLDEITFHSD